MSFARDRLKYLFGSTKGLILVAIAMIGLETAIFGMISGPMAELGVRDFVLRVLRLDLVQAEREGRIIILYHSIAMAVVAIETYMLTGLLKVQECYKTAVRLLMRYGDEPLSKVNHDRLERIFCAGEVLNAPAWDWLQNKMLKNRIPVIDHMWQTETGGPVFGNPYGLGMLPIKPGSATIPLPGIEVQVMTNQADGGVD